MTQPKTTIVEVHYWQQGRLLMTPQVKKWCKEDQIAGDNEERCMVFKHFSADDQGRSRELIARCRTHDEAAALVEEHNALVTLYYEKGCDQ